MSEGWDAIIEHKRLETVAGLSALLKRVEEAAGPDRELDAAIRDSFNLATYLPEPDDYIPHDPLHYTSSLDAALALVEKELPGWAYRIQRNIDGEIWATIGMGFDSKFGCATPAFALLSAFLRAKITEQAP